jgi:Cd2+/Zn2+-exporting ATPase
MPESKVAFKVHGMDCAEEVSLLKREVGPVVGGDEHLSFDLLTGRMTVRLIDDTLSPSTIEDAVSRAGLTAEPWSGEKTPSAEATHRLRQGRVIATAASGLATVMALSSHALLRGGLGAAVGIEQAGAGHGVPAVSIALYGIAIACGLRYVAPKAWLAIRRLRSDMNLLMTVAILGAVIIGEWFEAATVSFLFALSLALESWSIGRARRAVAALLDLAPPRARVLRADGSEAELLVEDVPVGSVFVVHPGERIPLDGEVVSGTTAVDEAPITGESVPREKGPGAEVFAGTINGDGAVEIRSTRPARDTVLARIIRMVGEAQERRAPMETWVDRFARVYTPVVMLAAIATAVLAPLLAGQPWGAWIYKGLVLLVIACPCALVISTPVSIVAALAAAARNGVLIKGGIFIEAPARLKSLALDKTGTITEGRQRVADVIAHNGLSEAQILERAAALEARSGHPIARAIVDHAVQLQIQPVPAEGVQDRRGRGVSGTINGKSYWAGSHRFLEEKGLETPEVHEQLVEMASGGKTVVVLGDDATVLGFITLQDAVRVDAVRVVSELHALGIGRVLMLTGDNTETAESVAATVGIDDVRAELLPEDKVKAVEELAADSNPIAMVGDGVNDAPAMARADIGIAMGAVGSDAAIEAADIALMSDDLTRLPWLIRHSRRTLRVIRQNIVFSLTVKAAFVVLTFVGYASLWAAIAADMGASLVVIANGLRLLHSRPGQSVGEP